MTDSSPRAELLGGIGTSRAERNEGDSNVQISIQLLTKPGVRSRITHKVQQRLRWRLNQRATKSNDDFDNRNNSAQARTFVRTYLDHVANLEAEHVTRHVSLGVDLNHQVKVALVQSGGGVRTIVRVAGEHRWVLRIFALPQRR